MKVPYDSIDKVVDLAEFAASYSPDFDETDQLAIRDVRAWLATRAKRLLNNQVARMQCNLCSSGDVPVAGWHRRPGARTVRCKVRP